MLNLYFDKPALDDLIQKLPEHPESRWLIENQGTTFRHVSAHQDAEFGWLRVWETPNPAMPYLVAITQGSLAVWRGPFTDRANGNTMPARLVAACVPEQAIQPTILYRWAALASAHYGDIPVLADITSLPAAAEEMRKIGVGILARRQPLTDRRLGQQSNDIRKPGHTFTDKEYQEAMECTQALLRDRKAELWCNASLRQFMAVTTDREGLPTMHEGAKDNWLKVHALALANIQAATQGTRQRGMWTTPPDYGGARQGAKRKLA